MKTNMIAKLSILMLMLMALTGCLTLEEDVVLEDCQYEGMYTVIMKGNHPDTNEYAEVEMNYWEVTRDWKVIGANDDSGYSGFLGSIEPDGSFFCEPTNFPGATLIGTISAEGAVVGVMDFLQYGIYDLEGERK